MLTDEEKKELEHLQYLQIVDNKRWLTTEEFNRIQELMDKRYKDV